MFTFTLNHVLSYSEPKVTVTVILAEPSRSAVSLPVLLTLTTEALEDLYETLFAPFFCLVDTAIDFFCPTFMDTVVLEMLFEPALTVISEILADLAAFTVVALMG